MYWVQFLGLSDSPVAWDKGITRSGGVFHRHVTGLPKHHSETWDSRICWKCGINFANWNLSHFFHPSPLLANPIKGFLHKTFNDLCDDALEKRRQRCETHHFWLLCAMACTAMLKSLRGLKIAPNTLERSRKKMLQSAPFHVMSKTPWPRRPRPPLVKCLNCARSKM
jgi:hypothetical protein